MFQASGHMTHNNEIPVGKVWVLEMLSLFFAVIVKARSWENKGVSLDQDVMHISRRQTGMFLAWGKMSWRKWQTRKKKSKKATSDSIPFTFYFMHMPWDQVGHKYCQ